MDQREENEKKKEYLKSYRLAIRREKILQEEIQRLRADKRFSSAVNEGILCECEKNSLSDYEETLDRILLDLKEQCLKTVRLYTEIQKRIKQMEDDTERDLLILKYLQGKTWEQVTEELSYSWKQIHRIHLRALESFKMT